MFKEAFFLAKDNEKRLKFIFFLMALRGVVKIIPYLILYLIILEIITPGMDIGKALASMTNVSINSILVLTACLAIVFILINVWDHYLGLFTMKSGHKICYDIRMDLGNKLRKLSLGFFTVKSTGELNTILSEYVSRIEMFISISAPYIFSAIASASTMLIFFLFLDWRMAIAAGSAIPLAIMAFTYVDKVAGRVTRKREESLRRTNSVIVEFIEGMPVIKIFNQVTQRFHKFKETMTDFRDKNVRAVVSVTVPSIILLTFTSLSIAIILPVGLYFYFDGTLPLSTFIFILITAPSFSDSLAQSLFGYLHSKSPEGQAIKNITEVMQEKPLYEPVADTGIKNFDIEFRGVSFSYDTESILHDINFKIPEKSVTALVGPSGSGKTTITSLIARFWDVDSGEVRIGGENIQEMKLDRLLSYISLVFQEVILFNDTVMENIRLGRKDATDEEVIAATKAARCHEFVNQLPEGYNTVIGEKGARLSGGEKQRISIARAILKDAPIIILDEATAFVDPENENIIQEAINHLTRGKTVLVIAHRLSTITHVDQTIVIEKGKIAEQGTHEALIKKEGLYKRMWTAHNTALGWRVS